MAVIESAAAVVTQADVSYRHDEPERGERMQNPSEHFARHDRHVIRGFYLIASLVAAICLCLLAISQVQSYVLDSVRAYVAGEGMWSKAEKEAIYRLTDFAVAGDEQDYQAFLRSIDITLGDRQARLALQQPTPDLKRARAGFLQGGNNPADVGKMIHFFLWFQHARYMAEAIAVWTKGDERIAELIKLGKEMHAEVRSGRAGASRIHSLLAQVDQLNGQITFLENQFSGTLGKGARWSRGLMRDIIIDSMLVLLVLGLLGSWRIVRSIHSTEQAQRIAAEVFHATAEGIVVTNDVPTMQMVNPAFIRITGYDEDELIGRNPSMLGSGHHDAEFYRQMWAQIGETGQWQGEILNRRKDGQVYPAWLSISAVRNDGQRAVQYVGICTDITDRKARETQIWHQAHFDILTDLPNRNLFHDRLAQQLIQARREKFLITLLFIDLDYFKNVNDTYGHKVGDLLLQQVAGRLTASVRESDTVGRLSGDEFAVVLPRMRDRRDAESLVLKISVNCARSYAVEGHDLTVSASIGVAVYPHDAEDARTLVHNADTAMYAAKQAGRGTFRFYADLNEEAAKA
jgi:diguanylate cyclase (GGDEF)-like protein/PAS domain S-box-containing protein